MGNGKISLNCCEFPGVFSSVWGPTNVCLNRNWYLCRNTVKQFIYFQYWYQFIWKWPQSWGIVALPCSWSLQHVIQPIIGPSDFCCYLRDLDIDKQSRQRDSRSVFGQEVDMPISWEKWGEHPIEIQIFVRKEPLRNHHSYSIICTFVHNRLK